MRKTVLLVCLLTATATACGNDGSEEGDRRDPGQTTTTQRGEVAVTAQSSGEADAATITAKVVNGRASSIYTEDMKTACSILHIERAADDGWKRIGECPAERAPIVVEIPSGQSRTVRIGASDAGASPGRYRAVLTYSLARRPEGNEPERAESAPFDVTR